jgi:zinc transport system permease protein
MWSALQFEFMRNALLASIIISVLCGIIGTLVVVNRLVFMTGGIAHSAYGGIGLGLYTGMSPFLGAGIFAVLNALIMGLVTVKDRDRADTIIGVLWAIGMAAGIIFVNLSHEYNVDLMSYLFGSILSVSKKEIYMSAFFMVLVISWVSLFYKELLAISYDEEFSYVVGIPVLPLYFSTLIFTAISVIIAMRMVGLILVIALISIPPYIAENCTYSLAQMMVLSSLFAMFFAISGLWFSYYFNIPASASIILIAGLGFFVSYLLRTFGKKKKWI